MATKETYTTPRIDFIEPMYAELVRELPEGLEWIYEIKFDGYRCLAANRAGAVALWSRRGNRFNTDFPEIARACARLPADTLIDGEVVAIDSDGRVSFNALQHRQGGSDLQYYVFDVLVYRGESVLSQPLEKRRKLLSQALAKTEYPVCLSETVNVRPSVLIRAAKENGFEGILAKRKDSLYEPGRRTGAWVKYKINRSQEFVIGGYTPGNPFDALIVGVYDGDALNFVAKVRNGFVPRSRREVYERIKGLEALGCPFANLPEKKRTMWALTAEEMKSCRWLKPKLVAQIDFTEW